MTKITRTPARLNTGHVLPAMTIMVDVIPVRSETTARDIADEVSMLLKGLVNAERIKKGHVSDRRWDISDREHASSVIPGRCRALLTTAEAAEILGVTPATVRRWINADKLVAEHNGIAWGIERKSVVDMLAARS